MSTEHKLKKFKNESDELNNAIEALEAFKSESDSSEYYGDAYNNESSGQVDFQKLSMVNRFKAQKRHFIWHFVLLVMMTVIIIYRTSDKGYSVGAINWVCFALFFVTQYFDHYLSKREYNQSAIP